MKIHHLRLRDIGEALAALPRGGTAAGRVPNAPCQPRVGRFEPSEAVLSRD